MTKDNTKFEWEKHSYVEPLSDEEIARIKYRIDHINDRNASGSARHIDVEETEKLLATIDSLKKYQEQTKNVGSINQHLEKENEKLKEENAKLKEQRRLPDDIMDGYGP